MVHYNIFFKEAKVGAIQIEAGVQINEYMECTHCNN